MPYLGHATMVKVLRALIIPFGAIFVLLAFYDFKHGSASFKGSFQNWQLFTAGLAFTFALSGVGWTECGNDYTRYVARDASKGSIVGWMFLGTAIPEIFMMVLGAATFTFISSSAQSAAWNGANPFEALHIQHTDPKLGRRAVLDLRDRAALRHQLTGPVLLGRVTPGHGSQAQALPGRRTRQHPGVRPHAVGDLPVDVLALHEGVRRRHHRVDRAVARDLFDGLDHAQVSIQRLGTAAQRQGRHLFRRPDRRELELHHCLHRRHGLFDDRLFQGATAGQLPVPLDDADIESLRRRVRRAISCTASAPPAGTAAPTSRSRPASSWPRWSTSCSRRSPATYRDRLPSNRNSNRRPRSFDNSPEPRLVEVSRVPGQLPRASARGSCRD